MSDEDCGHWFLAPAVRNSKALTSFTFPKSVRLSQPLEFRSALDKGVKAVCGDMIIFCQEPATSGTHTPALGLIVSKKVGPSVTRNKVKRHLRESFRLLRPALTGVEAFKSKNIVIIARPALAARTQVEVAASLRYCLKRLERQQEERLKLL